MTLGERIKLRRKELRINVDEIAEKLDKNRATIYRYESGEIENIPISILQPLAEILQTTPAYLMGLEVQKDDTNILSKRIKSLREEKKLSQLEMSNLIGINRQTLENWELNRAEPSNDMLIKLATFYDVTVDYLIGNSNEKKIPQQTKYDLDSEIEVTKEEEEFVDELIEMLLNDPEFKDSVIFDENQQDDFFLFVKNNMEYFKSKAKMITEEYERNKKDTD